MQITKPIMLTCQVQRRSIYWYIWIFIQLYWIDVVHSIWKIKQCHVVFNSITIVLRMSINISHTLASIFQIHLVNTFIIVQIVTIELDITWR